MERGLWADYLAGLDRADLVGLLRRRPDVRIEPVPCGFGQLAQRLGGDDSLVTAVGQVSRDCLVVGQAIAVTQAVSEAARLLDAPETVVDRLVDELCAWGLAWRDKDAVWLPELLAEHWSAEIGDGRPAASIARSVVVADLREAAHALGVDVQGLRKPELIDRYAQKLADTAAIARIVARLPKPARVGLDELRYGGWRLGGGLVISGFSPFGYDGDHVLAATGLVLRVNNRWELPREVAIAAWLTEQPALTGPPDIPPADTTASQVLPTAQAAIQELLRAVSTMLDEATSTPIAALKKGGVGTRERSRLATRMTLSPEMVVLIIDLTAAAGLLGEASSGYAPTDSYHRWRESEPAEQWSTLVVTWFALQHAPTSRELDGDKQLPPPIPLVSGAGLIRRAILHAARGGKSLAIAGENVDWFCPLHGYPGGEYRDKIAAVIREGHLLGVLSSDVLTEFGEHLVSAALDDPLLPDLPHRVTHLFPRVSASVVVQSDLTAVVSGQPAVAASRLLRAAAVCETRGTASIWRFTPDSIRAAMDNGWTATQLQEELSELSDLSLPQPLEFLIADVARRHGRVKVRATGCCVVADEAITKEILHTRKLTRLDLSLLAPTVLASPHDTNQVLTELRRAGFAPVAENPDGAVVIEHNHHHTAQTHPPKTRTHLGPTELAEHLLADPDGTTATAVSATLRELLDVDTRLTDTELTLLADALDHHRTVLITYRDKKGTRTRREIQPLEIFGRWLTSWCHLRNAEREFTLANIESVNPT